MQKALKELEDAGFGRPGKLDMKSYYLVWYVELNGHPWKIFGMPGKKQ